MAEHVRVHYRACIHPIIVANKENDWGEPSPGVIVDRDGDIHQTYGARKACLYVIRPDHYIAYRNQELQLDALTKYLDRVLI